MSTFSLVIILVVVALVAWCIFAVIYSNKMDKEDEQRKAKEREKDRIIIEKAKAAIGTPTFEKYKVFKGNKIPFILSSDITKKLFIFDYEILPNGENLHLWDVVFDYREIIDVDLIRHQDDVLISTKISTNNKNMAKRAVVGSIVGGTAGAVIGATTAEKNIENEYNHYDYYTFEITFERKKTFTLSIFSPFDALESREIYSHLVNITIENKNNEKEESSKENNTSTKLSVTEELIKLAELKDKGLLSDEEFNTAKNKLLNS